MQEITKNKELQKGLAREVHDMMLNRLHDIEGLDSVSWWPLAPGVWAIIILILLITFIRFIFYLKKRAWRLSWQGKIFEELDQMQKNINQLNAHESAIKLSEILRRIAMYKYPRNECAALIGTDWLNWLKAHDKNKFDWSQNGTILIAAVFAPSNRELQIKQVTDLIIATKNWVR